MRESALVLLVAGVALAAIVRGWSAARSRRIARDRLEVGVEEAEPEVPGDDGPAPVQPFLTRHPLVPWVSGGVVAGLILVVARLDAPYAAMFGVVVGLLAHEVEVYRVESKRSQIQRQLADALDLMVAALRAGASVLNSFEAAVDESRAPLKPQLEEVLGRIRYGDDPAAVFRALTARVPLETFRLFAAALTVHQEVGGSLAPTLATVGRIIRDRIELERRVSSLTVQSRASTLAIMGVTYFIGLLMWRIDPPRMEEFLSTTIGGAMFSGAVILQAVGVFWTSWMSRLNY